MLKGLRKIQEVRSVLVPLFLKKSMMRGHHNETTVPLHGDQSPDVVNFRNSQAAARDKRWAQFVKDGYRWKGVAIEGAARPFDSGRRFQVFE